MCATRRQIWAKHISLVAPGTEQQLHVLLKRALKRAFGIVWGLDLADLGDVLQIPQVQSVGETVRVWSGLTG